MIVNQFRIWAQTATSDSRADGASALARAYLYSHLDEVQQAEAVKVLTGLLDDPCVQVRRAIAEAFAGAMDAPHHVVLALAEDQPSVASIVLARSPILTDAELIDCAASAEPACQAAIARRPDLSSPVAAALAEIAAPDALVALAQNTAARLPDFSIHRMIARHSDVAELREALLRRPDLPTCARIDLVAATAQALAAFVRGRNWMSHERIARVAREAKNRAAIAIAEARPEGEGDGDGALALIAHLRQAGQLSVGFAARAILSGRVELFRAILSNLSGVALARVEGLAADSDGPGFAALYRRAELPDALLPAFRIALRASRDIDAPSSKRTGLSLAVVTRVLAACQAINSGELDDMIVLLRRFETEAARDEARLRPAAQETPLVLRAEAACGPLLLTDPAPSDLDGVETRRPALFRRRSVERLERAAREMPDPAVPAPKAAAYAVDLGAIEAELCAA